MTKKIDKNKIYISLKDQCSTIDMNKHMPYLNCGELNRGNSN